MHRFMTAHQSLIPATIFLTAFTAFFSVQVRADPPTSEPAITLESKEAEERPPVILGAGEQRMLRVRGLQRYSLGGAALRAHALPKQDTLLLKGVSPGNSDVWIWKSDGTSEHRT